MSATSPTSPTGGDDRPRTYGDIRARNDDTRWELIDGQAYAMAGPSWQHQQVVMALANQLFEYFRTRTCRVLPAPLDVRLPKHDEADDAVERVVQPDISVVCDLSKLDQRGCRGAPDLVVEVLSPSTAGRDNISKLALYEQHGVQQYWLVHPLDRILTLYRRDGANFGPPEISEASGVLKVSGYEGLEIDWDQVFADIPPPE